MHDMGGAVDLISDAQPDNYRIGFEDLKIRLSVPGNNALSFAFD